MWMYDLIICSATKNYHESNNTYSATQAAGNARCSFHNSNSGAVVLKDLQLRSFSHVDPQPPLTCGIA